LSQPKNSTHLLQSETVYQGRVFTVRRDQVSLPGGREVELDVLSHNGSVVIVPVDRDGRIWFVRQFRHPAGIELLELPAGTLEEGETPDECAAREIQEEIGLAAGKLQEIGSFFLAPGYSTEYMYAFLAQELRPSRLPADEDEILSAEPLDPEQVYAMAEEGSLQDAKTLAALHLAQHYLHRLPHDGP
jgi:ADP-ribose diphosphatase